MFNVIAVSYNIHESSVQQPDMTIIEAQTSTAPMPELTHPIDRWWVTSGEMHRTPIMSGTPVDAR
jgi:hypothetical protein